MLGLKKLSRFISDIFYFSEIYLFLSLTDVLCSISQPNPLFLSRRRNWPLERKHLLGVDYHYAVVCLKNCHFRSIDRRAASHLPDKSIVWPPHCYQTVTCTREHVLTCTFGLCSLPESLISLNPSWCFFHFHCFSACLCFILLRLTVSLLCLPLPPSLSLSTLWSTRISVCTRMICSTGSSQHSSLGIR